ncbi:hypothetical protein GGI25_000357 [Coemansia spiralis]|uniref:Uncharacterized protein n=2 Tax=Coemansia TaxID=4863 RepID=A0A9W8GBV8_9FUNG|nr:hypothetical protein BX070DRAFT_221547 [Coemansia spiralis]KAJ1996294.1 hypothetical protein EDC05_000184 [Coemansia umbellata]KAJ2625949.1 hypothetical protein GGI26_000033 [Coemansia sp. RSA 1358]KAJ2680722.1 hypothetical protein GGI25_000357 [Coemansia spiralis]
MDLGYEDPITRYDSSDSEDEASYPVPAPAPLNFVVRLSPLFGKHADTLVIRLLPLPADPNAGASGKIEGGLAPSFTQVGVIYAPAAQPKNRLPLGGTSLQTNNALARILQASDGVVHVAASASTSPELQHGWAHAVVAKLNPKRIVLVDALEADMLQRPSANAALANTYRSPAVLASVIVVGLAAAVLNYADTYCIPSRHVRLNQRLSLLAIPLLGAKEIDDLFSRKDDRRNVQQDSLAILADTAGRRETSASLYV